MHFPVLYEKNVKQFTFAWVYFLFQSIPFKLQNSFPICENFRGALEQDMAHAIYIWYLLALVFIVRAS